MPLESSHEKIARRAYELWQAAGCPDGAHDDHWLTAERELASASTPPPSGAPDHATTQAVATPADERHAAEHQAIQAELQKQAARAPQVPHTHAPKPTPAPPGKPVWSKPHSA